MGDDDFYNYLVPKNGRKIRDGFRNDIVLCSLTKNSLRSSPRKPTITICSESYNFISNDIWMHISQHIQPDEVQTFALICRQTAALVKTRAFWKNLLKRYCKQDNFGNSTLSANQNIPTGGYGDTNTQRSYVIRLLFQCYSPFLKRIQVGYTLDNLIGRSYVSSWHKEYERVWIMCYKFWNNLPKEKTRKAIPEVQSWELLADKDFPSGTNNGNPFEGVFLLVICCSSYIPFPNHLLYGSGDKEVHTRLIAAREILAKDIKSINLELDFQDQLKQATVMVRYPSLLKYKVMPWWHPDFRLYIK